jgi:hypothetical protein
MSEQSSFPILETPKAVEQQGITLLLSAKIR